MHPRISHKLIDFAEETLHWMHSATVELLNMHLISLFKIILHHKFQVVKVDIHKLCIDSENSH